MKNVLIFFFVAVLASEGQAAGTVQFLYVNGVNNSVDEHGASLRRIRELSKSVGSTLTNECRQAVGDSAATVTSGYSGIYNPTGSLRFGDEPSLSADAVEAAQQKLAEEAWLNEVQRAKTYAERKSAAASAMRNFDIEPAAIRMVAERGAQRATAYLNAGDSVVLVSHSQGTLIANRIYMTLLLRFTEADMSRFTMIHIGGAAAYVPFFNFKHSADKVTGPRPNSLLSLGGMAWPRVTALCPALPGQPVGLCPFRPGEATADIDDETFYMNIDRNLHNFVKVYSSGVLFKVLNTGEKKTGAQVTSDLLMTAARSVVSCSSPAREDLAMALKGFVARAPCITSAGASETMTFSTGENGSSVLEGCGQKIDFAPSQYVSVGWSIADGVKALEVVRGANREFHYVQPPQQGVNVAWVANIDISAKVDLLGRFFTEMRRFTQSTCVVGVTRCRLFFDGAKLSVRDITDLNKLILEFDFNQFTASPNKSIAEGAPSRGGALTWDGAYFGWKIYDRGGEEVWEILYSKNGIDGWISIVSANWG